MASLLSISPLVIHNNRPRRHKRCRIKKDVQVINSTTGEISKLEYRPLRLKEFFSGNHLRPGIVEFIKHAPEMLSDEMILKKIIISRKKDTFSPEYIIKYIIHLLEKKFNNMTRHHTSISSKLLTAHIIEDLIERFKLFLHNHLTPSSDDSFEEESILKF